MNQRHLLTSMFSVIQVMPEDGKQHYVIICYYAGEILENRLLPLLQSFPYLPH